VASLEVLLTRGQIVLETKPPRNPAWLKHIQLGLITQFITTLVKSHGLAPPTTGFDHQSR
jgi:hypothetical protein